MLIETERLIIRSIKRGDEIELAEMAKDGSLSELGFDENCSEWIGDWMNEAIELSHKYSDEKVSKMINAALDSLYKSDDYKEK